MLEGFPDFHALTETVTSVSRQQQGYRSMKFVGFLCVILLVVLVPVADSYPSGAPTSTCLTLLPVHQSNQPQISRSPYRVTATRKGSSIRVTITGNESFKGFVLQARNSRNPNRLVEGKFTTQLGLSQTIDCQNGRQNTLTHTNNVIKNEIVTEWTPTSQINDDVIFRATVVKNYDTFWTNIESPATRIVNNVERNNKEPSLDSSKMYDDCYVNKGCLGYPVDCYSEKNCEILLSYVNTGDGISFTMTGSLGSSKNYMATGLSTDRKMGDDSVTECFMENGRVMVQSSWNRGRDNLPLTLKPDGMYKWQFENGLASCTWTQPYMSSFNEGGPDARVFDLSNTSYYVLLAKGPMRAGGRVDYHTGKLASPESVNFTAYEAIQGGGTHDAIKVHGNSSTEDSESDPSWDSDQTGKESNLENLSKVDSKTESQIDNEATEGFHKSDTVSGKASRKTFDLTLPLLTLLSIGALGRNICR